VPIFALSADCSSKQLHKEQDQIKIEHVDLPVDFDNSNELPHLNQTMAGKCNE
jgi:hypothetical protein